MGDLLMPSYQPVPSGLVALASRGQRTEEVTPTILGPDGRPLTSSAFHSPVDYGPGVPLRPRIEQPGFAPREYQYQPGVNLVTTPRSERGQLSFPALKALVAACPYARIAIQYRKTQIRALEWDVVPVDGETKSARLARKAEIDLALEWLRMPNRIDAVPLSQWLAQAVEEILVTDSLTFYKHRTVGGGLHSLVQVDGSLFKPVIDEWGHIVAWQQILYGYPATQYPVYDRGDIAVLIYNPRIDSTYGTPPGEELAPLINVAIRRLAAQASWYMDGNVPVAFIEAPEGWSDTTIAGFQQYLDDTFSGNTAQRSRMRLLPKGANYQPAKPFEFTKDEEEAVLAQVLAHYGVPKHLLVAQTNRATAEQQSDEASDTGLKPLIRFLSEFLTGILRDDLGLDGLIVKPVTGQSGKELEKAQATVALVTAGVLTIEEARAEQGLDPIEETDGGIGLTGQEPQKEALNGTQVASLLQIVQAVTAETVPAESAVNMLGVAFPAVPVEVARAIVGPAAAAPKPEPVVAPPTDEPSEAAPPATKDDPEPTEAVEAQKAEIGVWRRWALRRVEKGKHRAGFEAKSLPSSLASEILAGLAAATTAAEVIEVFAGADARLLPRESASPRDLQKSRPPRPKPRPLSAEKARVAEKKIAGILGKLFAAEKARALAFARGRIGG